VSGSASHFPLFILWGKPKRSFKTHAWDSARSARRLDLFAI
jgi:hypothetical protein